MARNSQMCQHFFLVIFVIYPYLQKEWKKNKPAVRHSYSRWSGDFAVQLGGNFAANYASDEGREQVAVR
jgi:hypothetical protein